MLTGIQVDWKKPDGDIILWSHPPLIYAMLANLDHLVGDMHDNRNLYPEMLCNMAQNRS